MHTYRNLLLLIFFLFSLAKAQSQTYTPSAHVQVNDAVAPAQATPLEARSMFYDGTNFLYRAYQSTSEVLSYLNTTASRTGNFIIIVDSGGTLQGNGTYLNPHNTYYMFADSTTSGQLKKLNLFGYGIGACPGCLLATNNLSDLGSLATALINLGLNNVNNTSDATKNAATVTLTNKTMSGSSNTFTNIPNSALTNSTIGLTLNNLGATPQVTTTPAALGTSLVLAVPYANGSDSGFLKGTDWTFFHGKLDSVHVSNDSVYNCANGTCILQSVVTGAGAVNSVTGTNTSLLFSPTTGNVLGQVNPAYAFNWTGQHTFVSFAPIFSTLTTSGGMFYGNGFGQLLQTAGGTAGQIVETNGTVPSFFTPNAATVNGWLGYTALSNALGSTHIFVGNGSNIATDVAVTGDIAFNNTGLSTVQPNVISNSKLAQMPDSTLKGNNTASTANAADLTLTQVRSMLGPLLPTIPDLTYLGNVSGATSTPTALHINWYNVLDFPGIVGDSTTDCTTGLNNLIDTVEAHGGGTIFIPPGKYIISSTLTIPGPFPINIVGSGFSNNNVIALPFTANPGYGLSSIFYNQSSGVAIDNKVNGAQFINFCLANATATTTTTNTGIIMDSATWVIVNHVQINNFNTNIDTRAGVFFNYSQNIFDNAHTYDVKVASYAGLDAGDSRFENNLLGVTTSLGANDTLLYYSNGGGLKILNNKFAGGKLPIYIPWQGFTDIDISHNSIENSTGGYAILIVMANSSASLANLQIVSNQIHNGITGEEVRVDASVVGSNIFQGLIDANLFYGGSVSTDTAIVLAGNITSTFKITANNNYFNCTPLYSSVPASQILAMTFPSFVTVPLSSRMKLDMSLGNVFTIPNLTASDTIDMINGGAGNPFVIQVLQGTSTAYNLVTGNMSNQAQASTLITLNPTLSSVTYLYGFATGIAGGGGGNITNISRNVTNGSILFVKGGSYADNNPDLFWDNTNLRMGIKNNAPIGTFHVADNQTSFSNVTSGIWSEQNAASNDPARLIIAHSRGTYGSKTTLASGDQIGMINFAGNGGGGYLINAGIASKVEGTPSSSSLPQAIYIFNKTTGLNTASDPFQDTAVSMIFWPNRQITMLAPGSPKSDTAVIGQYGVTVRGSIILNDDSIATPNLPSVTLADTTHFKPMVEDTRSGLHYNTNWAFGGLGNYFHTITTPSTGGTVNLVDNQYNIINPTGALLALTVNLPSSPANNDVVYIKYTQTITTVTYGNGTVVDGITGPAAGGLVVLTYDSATTSWY